MNFLVSVFVCIYVKSGIFYFIGTKEKTESSKKGKNWENLKQEDGKKMLLHV